MLDKKNKNSLSACSKASISENVRDRLGYKELKSKCDLQSRIDKWSFSRDFSKHIFW